MNKKNLKLSIILLILLLIPAMVYAESEDGDAITMEKTDRTIPYAFGELFTCLYSLHTNVYNGENEVRIPLEVVVYENGLVRYFNNGYEWDPEKGPADNQIYIANGTAFGSVGALLKTDSYYKEATKNNNYSCPAFRVITSQSSNSYYQLEVGGEMSTNDVPVTNGGTPLTRSQTCIRKFQGQLNGEDLNLEFHFNLFKSGHKEICVKDLNSDGSIMGCSLGSTAYDFGSLTNRFSFGSIDDIFKQNAAQLNQNTFSCPNTLYLTYEGNSGVFDNFAITTTKPQNTDNVGIITQDGGSQIVNPDDDNVLKIMHQCKKEFKKGSYAALDYDFILEMNLLSNGAKQVCIDPDWSDKTCKDVEYVSDNIVSWVVTMQKGYYMFNYFIESKEIDKFFAQDDQDRQNQTFKCPENIYIYYANTNEMGFTTDRNDFDDSTWNDELEEPGSNENQNNSNMGDQIKTDCEVIPLEIREWIQDTLNLVKYVCLVLVIVLGVLDFLKAAGSGEAEDMKKSGQTFLKRIIAVVVLFLLPVIVDLILNLVEIYGADSTCLPE